MVATDHYVLVYHRHEEHRDSFATLDEALHKVWSLHCFGEGFSERLLCNGEELLTNMEAGGGYAISGKHPLLQAAEEYAVRMGYDNW